MLNGAALRDKALELGFDLIGAAPAGPTPGAGAFIDWLAAGRHGDMGYLAREPHKRADPRQVLGNARSVVMVGVSYETLSVPAEILTDPSRGRIARYTWGRDYHDVITPRLRELGDWAAAESRAYVDTGPILERAWAQACGLGFVGKNTCLIHRDRGSFMFLGALLLADDVDTLGELLAPPAKKSKCGCGGCTRCLDACPTGAFAGPGVLDSRRCISYLTIELKSAIPESLRPSMGNWIFGCDICQDVCPYVRRYSRPADGPLSRAFYPVDVERAAPKLLNVLSLNPAQFNAAYKGTPLARAKRRGLLRNACMAAGNWGDASAGPALRALADDPEPLIREHAVWALARI